MRASFDFPTTDVPIVEFELTLMSPAGPRSEAWLYRWTRHDDRPPALPDGNAARGTARHADPVAVEGAEGGADPSARDGLSGPADRLRGWCPDGLVRLCRDDPGVPYGNETSTPLQGLLLALFSSPSAGSPSRRRRGWRRCWRRASPGRRREGGGAEGRTALLMPVYNEDPSATCAALQAMGEELADLGVGEVRSRSSSCRTRPTPRSGCARPPVSRICAPRWRA